MRVTVFKFNNCFLMFQGNMKQHFMTHKLRGDPGYEEADESQSASTPDSVCSSTRDSPKANGEELKNMENSILAVQQPPSEDQKILFNAYQSQSPQSIMPISPNGKLVF